MDRLREWFSNCGIHTLVNVYQERYREGEANTGLGDYLRGCYFLMQVCHDMGVQCEIEMRHPLGRWMQVWEQRDRTVHPEVPRYAETNRGNNEVHPNGDLVNVCRDRESMYRDFCAYLQQEVRKQQQRGTMSMYNICFPWEDSIRPHHREKMRQWLTPSTAMQTLLDETLSGKEPTLPRQGYTVLHLRCGDAHLVEGSGHYSRTMLGHLFNHLDGMVASGVITDTNGLVLLGDSLTIKHIVQEHYPALRIHAWYHPIIHFGEGVAQNDDEVRNSMLDFYLLSRAGRIYCFTTYTHGSGFSKWCAMTYQIPYVDKYLPTKRDG